MPRRPISKIMLTSRELAAYLKVHPLTVMRYAREGKIPAFKIGPEWRFSKKYIDRWLRGKFTAQLSAKRLSERSLF